MVLTLEALMAATCSTLLRQSIPALVRTCDCCGKHSQYFVSALLAVAAR